VAAVITAVADPMITGHQRLKARQQQPAAAVVSSDVKRHSTRAYR